MASKREARSQSRANSAVASGDRLIVHRLELPPELAEIVAKEAEIEERTVPAQIRAVLKQWAARKRYALVAPCLPGDDSPALESDGHT